MDDADDVDNGWGYFAGIGIFLPIDPVVVDMLCSRGASTDRDSGANFPLREKTEDSFGASVCAVTNGETRDGLHFRRERWL